MKGADLSVAADLMTQTLLKVCASRAEVAEAVPAPPAGAS